MSVIEIEALLSDVAADMPCGEDLEYDPEFAEMEKLAQGGMPMDTIKVSDIERLGELSGGPNYLKLEGARPLDDPYYRTPNWSKDQAMRLGELHDKYDSLKRAEGSRFAPEGKNCEDQTNVAGRTPVSLERPAVNQRPSAGMKL